LKLNKSLNHAGCVLISQELASNWSKLHWSRWK